MADSILKIRTQDGDKPIGYPGLADKPVANKELDTEGAFADAKAVGDKFKEVKTETDSLKEDLDDCLHYYTLTGWVNGVWTNSGIVERPDRAISDAITVKKSTIITSQNGYEFDVHVFDLKGNHLEGGAGWKTGDYVINYDDPIIRVQCRKENGATIDLGTIGTETPVKIRCTLAVTKDELNKLTSVINTTVTSNKSKYYAKVVNPTSLVNYTDYPCEIRVNFEKGICRKTECITIKDPDGNIVPFTFRPCRDENIAIDSDYSLWNDGSIRCGDLVILTTVAKNSSIIYTIEIDSLDVGNQYEKTVNYSEHAYTDGSGKVYSLLSSSNLTLRLYDEQQYRVAVFVTERGAYAADIYYGFLDSDGTNHREIDSDFTTNYVKSCDIEIIGDGAVFLTVRRTLYFDLHHVVQDITLYANNRLDVDTWVIFDEQRDGDKRHYCRYKWITQNEPQRKDCVNGSPFYMYTENNNDVGCGVLVHNGNSQRDDTTLPIYETRFDNSSALKVFDVSAYVIPSNTDYWYKGLCLFQKFTYTFGTDAYESYRTFNSLTSCACNKHYYVINNETKDILLKNTKSLLNAFLNSYPDRSHSFVKYYVPFFSYAEYLIGNKRVIDVFNAHKNMMETVYGGNTSDAIMNVYTTKSGIEYIGRSLPISYILYKEYVDVDEEKKNYCLSTIKAYADFIVSIYNNKSDIPLKYGQTVGNSNSRSMALYGLSIAIKLLDNNTEYIRVFEAVNTLVKNAMVAENMQPEGTAYERYLHYTAFANFYYVLALNNYTPSNKAMRSSYNYMLDAMLPNGEIKDTRYCCSKSRRGLPHTYAYVIGVLTMSHESYAAELAKCGTKWLCDQTPPFGGYPDMLDEYDTYEKQKCISGVGFAIVTMVEIICYINQSRLN